VSAGRKASHEPPDVSLQYRKLQRPVLVEMGCQAASAAVLQENVGTLGAALRTDDELVPEVANDTRMLELLKQT